MDNFWRFIIWVNAIGLFIFISTQLWWTETGYCVGSFIACNT